MKSRKFQEIYHITVLDTPVPQSRSRSLRVPGGIRTYSPITNIRAQQAIREKWLDQYPEFQPLDCDLELELGVFVKCPKNVSRKARLAGARPSRRPDLSNYIKQAEDALDGVAYVDDAQIVTIRADKRYAIDEEGYDTVPCWKILLRVI
jgi:Holliday junction resolvase RusA-like endonuclease